jgi:transcriptional regulator with XRE-family HTH domain
MFAGRCYGPGMDTEERTELRAARLDKGWTQTQLAAVVSASGVSVNHTTIYRIERGETSPRPALRKALADALGRTAQELGL